MKPADGINVFQVGHEPGSSGRGIAEELDPHEIARRAHLPRDRVAAVSPDERRVGAQAISNLYTEKMTIACKSGGKQAKINS